MYGEREVWHPEHLATELWAENRPAFVRLKGLQLSKNFPRAPTTRTILCGKPFSVGPQAQQGGPMHSDGVHIVSSTT